MSGALTFDEATHTYRVDGRVVPSVTQILKAVYPDVYAGIPAHVLDRKARLGTAVHKAIELELLGKLDYQSIHPEVQPYFWSWMQWWEDQHISPVACKAERKFYCEAGYAGTVDFEYPVACDVGIVDWKITSAVVATHPLQGAGYAYARGAVRSGSLYLRSSGAKAELVEHDVRRSLPDWLATLRVYNTMQRMR